MKNIYFSLLFCGIFFLVTFKAISQNIFDAEHSLQYANYLYNSGQYKLAGEEFERVLFFNNSDTVSAIKLVKSYSFLNDYENGIIRTKKLFAKDIFTTNTTLAFEYEKMLLLSNNIDTAKLFSEKFPFSTLQKNEFQLSILLMQNKWSEARNFTIQNQKVSSPLYVKLNNLALETQKVRLKNPYLAAGMSVLIPGSGKMYCGYWKDGIISLLFVAGNTWQSYRGFKKYGKESIYGWILGGMAIGFYTGNIYGSFKAAKRYNSRKYDLYYHKTRDLWEN